MPISGLTPGGARRGNYQPLAPLEQLASLPVSWLQENKKREQQLERLREETERKLTEANNESMQVRNSAFWGFSRRPTRRRCVCCSGCSESGGLTPLPTTHIVGIVPKFGCAHAHPFCCWDSGVDSSVLSSLCCQFGACLHCQAFLLCYGETLHETQ